MMYSLEHCPPIDQIIESLYTHGIMTSVCVGPVQGERGAKWSVTCMDIKNNAEFQKPFAAKDFYHGMQIAYLECKSRGWLEEKRLVRITNNLVVG